MDRLEIVVPRSNGEAVFGPCGQKSAFGAQIMMLQRTRNNNCRQAGIIVDVHQTTSMIPEINCFCSTHNGTLLNSGY
jgi:hypothetical protein